MVYLRQLALHHFPLHLSLDQSCLTRGCVYLTAANSNFYAIFQIEKKSTPIPLRGRCFGNVAVVVVKSCVTEIRSRARHSNTNT